MSYAPSAAAEKRIEALAALYPERAAALLPVLRVVQEETGFVPPEAEAWVAAKLGIRPIQVREVLTFYTMFRRTPGGRTVVRVCRNLSCALAGAEGIIGYLRERLGLGEGEDTTPDGRVSLVTAECLGNCDQAPCLQVDGIDRGRMTMESAAALVEELRGR